MQYFFTKTNLFFILRNSSHDVHQYQLMDRINLIYQNDGLFQITCSPFFNALGVDL